MKNLKLKNLKIFNTRMGNIHYADHDIYTFDMGLTGFKQCHRYIKTRSLPQLNCSEFGLLQSCDNSDLCFILYYPEFPLDMKILMRQKVLAILKASQLDTKVENHHLEIAFFVLIDKQKDGSVDVRLVEEGPIVFANHIKKAWQIMLQ